MNKNDLKSKVCSLIDQNSERITSIGDTIFQNPELGYKETKTSALVKETFDSIGISYTDGHGITGVKGKLKNNATGANVALMGELDAVVCPLHPNANPESGAAHSCGHNGQIAAMLGAAIGLKLSGAEDILDGNITFFAVPAEECVELEFRNEMIESGKIHYYGGKQELIHNGDFDDIDMAILIHGMDDSPEEVIDINSPSVGFITKRVQFVGKESHAGLFPEQGINALNAASLAIMAINSCRETFRDQDYIRVHPIITKGGDLVNIVPADVRLETYVRGRTIEAIKDANFKVNRAIKGAAYALGATAIIEDIPGYLPTNQNAKLSEIFAVNKDFIYENPVVVEGPLGGASSDMGDLQHIMPAIQPAMGGFSGGFHSKNLMVTDPNKAYIAPAKALACAAIDLLWDNCAKANEISADFKGLSGKDYDNLWGELLKYED